MKVAVTAVGGGVGQSILKALSGSEYEAVGIDARHDAMGLYYAKSSYIGKNCNEEDFIDTLINICKKEDCKFLFPAFDAELKIISKNRNRFINNGIVPIISDEKVIELSDNKYELYQFLKKNGFPYIKTAKNIEEFDTLKLRYPIILKPMVDGCRSKDVFEICERATLVGKWNMLGENFIAQECIEGEEYTCGTITFGGYTHGTIIMRRELRNGDTYKAYVENPKGVDAFLHELLKKINPFGPCNIQLRIKENVPYVFEINARCSGTTAARALAGFNEPVMICDFLTKGETTFNIKEIAILRYWNEHVVDYKDIRKVQNEGYFHRV